VGHIEEAGLRRPPLQPNRTAAENRVWSGLRFAVEEGVVEEACEEPPRSGPTQ